MNINNNKLIKLLKWDTSFFGFPVAIIKKNTINKKSIKKIINFCKKYKIKLLMFSCNPKNPENVILAEKYKFHFADMRLIFEKDISNYKLKKQLPKNLQCTLAKQKDEKSLKKISKDIYKDSRYYFDRNFDKNKIKEFYLNWISKSLNGKLDDYVFMLVQRKNPIGYITIKHFNKHTVRIGLVGIDSKKKNKGFGKMILTNVLMKLKNKGINKIYVVTQGRNYNAQRLYQKCGFVTSSAEIWYHLWF